MSKINDLEQEVKADVKEATEAVSAENANKPWFKRLSLTTWIFIALALGVVAGLALQGTPDIATTYIKPLGTIFLNLIKMIVVPLVIFSMIAGVISLSDIKKVGAIGGKTIAYYLCTTACAIVIGLVIMVGLQLFVKFTKQGKAMRAVSEDKEAAVLMGINVNSTIALTFAIGSGLAAVASLMYCVSYPQVSPMMGAMLGLKAFVAAVLGGIGSIPGAMVGGLVIGVVESLTKAYIGTITAGVITSAFSDAIVFGILIIVLLVKPSGLMGEPESEKV